MKMAKTKICTKCKKRKSLIAFSKHPNGKNGLDPQCKKCRNAYYEKYRQTHKGKISKYLKKYWQTKKGKFVRHKASLKLYHNMTLEQFDKMLEKQNGVCAICGGINPEGRRLYVDHDHKTGKTRGLLCQKCNTYLGILENGKFVDSAKKYLKKYKTI